MWGLANRFFIAYILLTYLKRDVTMKQIEVGKEVKILTNFIKLTVVDTNNNNVECELKDSDGSVHLVKLPRSVLAPASIGFLDLL